MRTLAGLLRVAVGLDRTRTGVVRGVKAEISGRQKLVITGVTDGDAELELYSARLRAGLLEEALGVPVELLAE